MQSRKLTGLARRQAVNEIMRSFIDLVLIARSTDMPKWIEMDLTGSQSRAMMFLAFRGALTIGELAKLLGIGNPAASILVQQLVQQQLVERSEDANDRRRTLVRLTERGAELMRERRELRETKFRHWLGQMSDDELAALLQGIGPLVRIVRAEQASADSHVEKANR